MQKKSHLWRFSGILRWLTLIMAGLYSLYFLLSWTLALLGETEMAFDWIDIVSNAPLSLPQIAFGFFCTSVASLALILIALAANRLLKLTYAHGFIQDGVSKGLKDLGIAMTLLWAGFTLCENFMPWSMTLGLPEDQQREILWFILDPNIVAMLVGFVLILLSEAIDEAVAIDADNKQII